MKLIFIFHTITETQGNAFPKIWVDTLSVLLDKCPHKPFPVVKALIEEEIQKPIDEIFSYIEEEPIGAASIGQVNKKNESNGKAIQAML